ncbi:MAG: hypothetical protein WBN92_05820 [Terriglobia bacterium]
MKLDFLNSLNVAATAAKSLVDVWSTIRDRKDRETASMLADLTDLMEELRKTHSTIVKLVSPLRRIPDSPSTFVNDFKNVYNDFRDFYDAHDFGDERTHCHKIIQIQNRMLKRKPLFGSNQQWTDLYASLKALANADLDIIDYQFKPFMAWFDQTMNRIKSLIDNNDLTQAISEKRAFLGSLGQEYDKNKAMLEEMTDTVGKLTAGL